MAGSYVSLWSELAARIPSLSPQLAPTFVNRAWRNIRDRRAWSFLFQPFLFNAPDTIGSGTVTCTLGSAMVVCDATAQAAITAALAALDPPTVAGLQFRIASAGPVYSILSYAAPNLTLTQPFQGGSGAGQSFSIYQAYYPTPTLDFVRWVSIYCPNEGYAFTKLSVNQQILNRMDPERQNQQQPIYASPLATGPDGRFLYEFWPTPTAAQTFAVLYQRRGLDLVNPTDSLPGIISDDCVIERACYYAYKWALANSGRLPGLKGVNWGYLIADHENPRTGWMREHLQPLLRLDDEVRQKSLIVPEPRGWYGPISGAYLQSHTGFFNWPG